MNAWNKYVAALWSVKWTDAKALPALFCLLLIVEVTPHLWAFKPPNLTAWKLKFMGPLALKFLLVQNISVVGSF